MPDGPFLAAALLCERTIEDKDGSVTIIRLTDQVTQTATGPDPPEQMPPTNITLTAVVVLKAGNARGRYAVKLRPETPAGQHMPTMEMPVTFSGNEAEGAGLIVEITIQADMEGLYWFDVLFARGNGEEQLLSRIPLRVVYQPQRTGPIPESSG